jgi:hypothetical protein
MKKSILLFVMGIAVATQTLFAQVPSYVPTNGLVAYYPFNGNANDASGNGNNGTVNGATLTTDRNGNANSAYLFNGTSNNIGINNPFMGGIQVSSFSLYTRIKTIGSPSSGSAYNIWGKSFSWGEINFGVDSNNTVYIVWANSNNGNTYTHIQTTSSIIPNTWYDVIITFQNSEVKIYFNATNQASIDYYGTNSLANFAQDSNSNKIGSRIFGGQTVQYFNGVIDDFGVWNRALSQQEVTTIYNQIPTYSDNCNNVSGSLTQGLVGYWPFCGNANDDSGNGNHGIVNGATLTTDRFGNVNSAYDFNGTNNFIELVNSTQLDNMSNFSISTWYQVNNTSPQFQFLVSKDLMGDPPNGDWDFYINYNKVKFDITINANNNSGTQNSLIQPNTWNHALITRNSSSGLINIYINGILENSFTGYIGPYSNTQKMNFGRQGSSNQHFLNGKLDDIGIWNRVLTPAEISQLYNQNQCFTNTTVTDTLVINVGQLSFTNPVTYANNITIAPNPASTQITISFNNITDLTGGTINVVNALGQQVATTPITASGTNTSMALNTWGSNGMYYVQIVNANGVVVDVKKIILQ